jgi:phospholipid transport system substrate-binding protein
MIHRNPTQRRAAGPAFGRGGARTIRRAVLAAGMAVAVALLLPSTPVPAAAAASPDALAQTKAVVDQALQILRNPNLSLAEERRELRDLAEQRFDFPAMARSTLGYHWRELPEDQRTEFVKLFSAFIEDAYLNRIQEYAGQDIKFVSQRADGPDYVEVDSKVVGGGDSPVDLTFRLKKDGDDWKIYDVTVDQISITANYRNQFNRVINNEGFPTLINDLRAKQGELAAMLGKRS